MTLFHPLTLRSVTFPNRVWEIAEKTARVLLGVVADSHTLRSTPVRIDAYEFHLRGWQHLAEGSPESFVWTAPAQARALQRGSASCRGWRRGI